MAEARRSAASGGGLSRSHRIDQWPRGRIVYETCTRSFILYADRRLQKPDIIDALKTAFGLTDSELIVRIRSDSHYR